MFTSVLSLFGDGLSPVVCVLPFVDGICRAQRLSLANQMAVARFVANPVHNIQALNEIYTAIRWFGLSES